MNDHDKLIALADECQRIKDARDDLDRRRVRENLANAELLEAERAKVTALVGALQGLRDVYVNTQNSMSTIVAAHSRASIKLIDPALAAADQVPGAAAVQDRASDAGESSSHAAPESLNDSGIARQAVVSARTAEGSCDHVGRKKISYDDGATWSCMDCGSRCDRDSYADVLTRGAYTEPPTMRVLVDRIFNTTEECEVAMRDRTTAPTIDWAEGFRFGWHDADARPLLKAEVIVDRALRLEVGRVTRESQWNENRWRTAAARAQIECGRRQWLEDGLRELRAGLDNPDVRDLIDIRASLDRILAGPPPKEDEEC